MCTSSRSHAPWPHIARQRGEAGEKLKARDKQSNVKGQGHRDLMDEAGFPGKTLAGAASAAPASPLPGQLAHTSGASHPRAHGHQHHQPRWAGAREAPPWWHADLCEDKEYSRSDKDWRATILVKILIEENPQDPRQDPCRGRQRATARSLLGHPARP